MKSFGILLCVAALAALIFGFSYDTSVATGLGGRVHNIGLMSDKQNSIIVGGALLVAGALILALSSRSQAQVIEGQPGYRRCPSCDELVKSEAKVCRFCQRDLPSLSELRAQKESELLRLTEVRKLEGETARQAEEKLPRGVCPNCKKTIPPASHECKHCGAGFGAGSAWHVLPQGEA